LFLDLSRIILFPSLILNTSLFLSNARLGCLTIPCHIGFIISWAIIVRLATSLVQFRERRMLNARPIPCVVGKWPGNIDVLFRILRAMKTSYVLDVYLELFQEYQCTTLNTRILWVDNIITMDQEHSKYVLATGFNHFWRGPLQKERLETFLGQGIFNRDDEVWKSHRATARPFFARERISDFNALEKHWERTLAVISSSQLAHKACEAQDLHSRFTLDAASEFLFGRNLDTLSATLPQPGRIGPKGSATEDSWGSFVQAFEMAQQVATRRSRIGYFFPLFELTGDANEGHSTTIRTWIDPLVQRALQDNRDVKKAGITQTIGDLNFLQHLADSTDDPIFIRDQLLNVLLAARDTTACLLTFSTYFMAIHPEMTKRLRDEVLEHCGPDSPPTYATIRKLRYMRAFINEVLHLYPPVPMNVQQSRDSACTMPASDYSFSLTSR
ncbi:cytochrome P450, partial [Mycena floridula]